MPIEFTGWREDVASVLARLDLLVVPTAGTEGFGRVVIEAFSARVPVVAFHTGGIAELIEDGVTGFLVKEINGDREIANGKHRFRDTVARKGREVLPLRRTGRNVVAPHSDQIDRGRIGLRQKPPRRQT